MVSRKTVARMSLLPAAAASRCATTASSHVFSHQLAKLAGRQRRPGAARPHGRSATRAAPTAATTSTPASTASAAFSTARAARTWRWSASATSGTLVISHFARPPPQAGHRRGLRRRPGQARRPLIDGCRCFRASTSWNRLVRDLGIQIAVLTTPPAAAQEATDTLVRAGVRSIVSFAATPLQAARRHLVESTWTSPRPSRRPPTSPARRRRPWPPRPNADADKVAPRCCASSTSLLAGNEVKLDELARHIGAQHRRRASSCRSASSTKIYAGDRVSDLLNEASDRTLLVTNLMSLQMIRVAELMDVPGICFVNGV